MKTAQQILKEHWEKRYNTQPYETGHLYRNYEKIVIDAMEEYANQKKSNNKHNPTIIQCKCGWHGKLSECYPSDVVEYAICPKCKSKHDRPMVSIDD